MPHTEEGLLNEEQRARQKRKVQGSRTGGEKLLNAVVSGASNAAATGEEGGPKNPASGFLQGLADFFDVDSFGDPSIIPEEQRIGQVMEGLTSLEAGRENAGHNFIHTGFNNLSSKAQSTLLGSLPLEQSTLVQKFATLPLPPQGLVEGGGALMKSLFGGEAGS